MESHRRTPLLRAAALLAAVIALALPQAALAITNGVPDKNGHPNAGMFSVDENGKRIASCSGSYAGERRGAPGTGVFLTAAHCLADLPEDAQLWVTFEADVTIDPETFEVTAASWYRATDFDVHPDAGASRSNPRDYGVILLETTVPVVRVAFPREGLLGDLVARGGLRPGTLIDVVGYGAIPTFKGAPPRLEPPSERMLATSRFSALTHAYVGLLGNPDAQEGLGGACFGDSGAPNFLHGTNRIVSIMSGGGDAICRAKAFGARLDIPEARSFLGQYVSLP
jgi:Trypsin